MRTVQIHFISASVLLSEQCWYQAGSDRGGVISWPAPGSAPQWRLILQYNTFSILRWNLSLIGPASVPGSAAVGVGSIVVIMSAETVQH